MAMKTILIGRPLLYRASGGSGPFIAPPETYEKLATLGVPENELVMIWPNEEYRCGDVTLCATLAIPSARTT